MTYVKNCAPNKTQTQGSNFYGWDKWLNDFVNDPFWQGKHKTTHTSEKNSTVPAVNIVEMKDDFRVEVAAPGLEKEDFKVELNKRILSISADKKVEEGEATETFKFKEFNFTSFKRSFKIPQTVDGDKIRAEYRNGILNVFLPKKEEAKEKPAREINID